MKIIIRYPLRCGLAALSIVTSLCAQRSLTSPSEQPLTSSPAIERRVDSLLSLMTLEEKLGQLNQVSGTWDTVSRRMELAPIDRRLLREGRVGSILNVIGAEATRRIQRTAVEETRHKIPVLFGLDVIHGFRTIFPIPLAEAATFDPDLIEQATRVAAVEATAAGIHWTFAPMVDIARDPRWGRIAEGSGEDPYLGSLFAAARVRGFQGRTFADRASLMACAKHFAAYGGAEGGRDYNTVDVSERTLREVYLPPFYAAVTAGAGTLMAAFNEVGGVPSSANPFLLTDVLRKEWGFQGFVVSDWTSVAEVAVHGLAGDREHAGMVALAAGVDMDMASRIYVDELRSAVGGGRLSMAMVDESARRILRIKFLKGLFEDPYRGVSVEQERTAALTANHRILARKVTQRSIVLLKNDGGLLPLRKDIGTVAVLGPLALSTAHPLGCWDARGDSSDVVSLLDGIRGAVGQRTKVLTAQGCGIDDMSTAGFAEARDLAMRADAVILALGEARSMSGEASNRSTLDLPGVQERFLEEMMEVGKPVVLVLMNGRPLSISWAAEHVPAMVEGWFGGVEAGNALADVLFGDVNPSGRLPVTVPRTVGQVPIYYNHKNTGRPPSEDYFTSKYLDLPSSPLFPFGHGLSYTTFEYSPVRVSTEIVRLRDTLRVSVDVKNTGTREGEEVVQLYVRDVVGTVTRPVQELKAIRRISLGAGKSALVTFLLTSSDLAFWNSKMEFATEPGMFEVMVGGNSVDGVRASFELVPR